MVSAENQNILASWDIDWFLSNIFRVHNVFLRVKNLARQGFLYRDSMYPESHFGSEMCQPVPISNQIRKGPVGTNQVSQNTLYFYFNHAFSI